MMLKIFIVYFVIGLFLTIKVGRDDFVRWIDEDHLSMPEVVMTAIGISLLGGGVGGVVSLGEGWAGMEAAGGQ